MLQVPYMGKVTGIIVQPQVYDFTTALLQGYNLFSVHVEARDKV